MSRPSEIQSPKDKWGLTVAYEKSDLMPPVGAVARNLYPGVFAKCLDPVSESLWARAQNLVRQQLKHRWRDFLPDQLIHPDEKANQRPAQHSWNGRVFRCPRERRLATGPRNVDRDQTLPKSCAPLAALLCSLDLVALNAISKRLGGQIGQIGDHHRRRGVVIRRVTCRP